jgi:hypothetical protein
MKLILTLLLLAGQARAATIGLVDKDGHNQMPAQRVISSGVFDGGFFQGDYPFFNSAVTCAMTETALTRSALDTCVTGSALTITTAHHFIVYFTGSAINTGATTMRVSFLVDSGYFSPFTATMGVTDAYANGYDAPLSFTTPPLAITPGSHTFCLTGFAASDTMTLPKQTYSQACFGVLSLP